jgi:type II secretory pathway pseudopilin PulG
MMLLSIVTKGKGIAQKTAAAVRKGFSIIELMIAVGIFIILTSVAFYGYADFNNDMVMTNQAYELSLHVRQAQVYGIAVRGGSGAVGSEFTASYGVVANVGSSVVTIFRDTNDDGLYDPSDPNEPALELLTFARGVEVCRICAITSGTDVEGGCSGSFDDLAITFKRPDPGARVAINDVPFDSGPTYSLTRIAIQAPNGKERYVDVTVTGQVSVRNQSESGSKICDAP